jgi:ABC-type uncharacterized transport system permease subunit
VPLATAGEQQRSRRGERVLHIAVRSLFPVVLALVPARFSCWHPAGTRSPSTATSGRAESAAAADAWQDSAIRMAPLLLIGAGLTVVFRANIWNLGYNGQFPLAAAVVTG